MSSYSIWFASRKCEESLSRYRWLGVLGTVISVRDGPRRKKDEKEEREKEEAAEFEMQLGSENQPGPCKKRINKFADDSEISL